jgi:hypothetical protein
MGHARADGSVWALSEQEGGVLAARWWRWALSAPGDYDPVEDDTGDFADWRQPDDLWFLAGTYGGRAERRCAIPADRPLFFPVLGAQHTRWHSREPLRLPVVTATAHLNGLPLPLREFSSPPFRIRVRRRLAWGLWAGLTPLIPGEYVLEIKAAALNGLVVDTTYHLTVTDGP